MAFRHRTLRRRRHRDGPLRSMRLNLRTFGWLAGRLARTAAADARRMLRRHGPGWR